MEHFGALLRGCFSTDFMGCMRWMLLGLVGGTLIIAWLAGVRLFVVPPIGAVPDGVTLVIAGMPGLRAVDSADSICARLMGGVSLLCRGLALAKVAEGSMILARLPYSATLDAMAGGTAALPSPAALKGDLAPALERSGDDNPGCLRLTINRVFTRYDRPRALITIKNDCGRAFGGIFVECTWLKADAPVATGIASINNLSPGQEGTDEAAATDTVDIDSARCRISNVY